MGKAVDLTGQRFGKLTVVRCAGTQPPPQSKRLWECACDCGKVIIATTDRLRAGNTASCGCARFLRPLADRFWRQVDRSAGPDACWLWLGARDAREYGRIAVGSKRDGAMRSTPAHRVAFTLDGGALADGQVACHRCDNPPCCNPAHIFAGTQADNLADMRAKGRAPSSADRSLISRACAQRGDAHWTRRRKADAR